MEALVGGASNKLTRSVDAEYIGELSGGCGERLNLEGESKAEVGAAFAGAGYIDDRPELGNLTEGRSGIE